MADDPQRVLAAAFPDEPANHFLPMMIGDSPASADEGAAMILDGIKTTTSSGPWDYPDGRVPFVGALSVLLDGKGTARGIVRTVRVETIRFADIDEDYARAYGEGERTLAWFRKVMGPWYARSAARHGAAFSDDTKLICEWIEVVQRL